VLLAVLAHTYDGAWRIPANHEDRGTIAAFDKHLRRVTLHRLEGARNTPLPVQRTQGYAEHRHIHLRTVLCGETCGHHLNEAHPGATVHGFADRSAGDKGRHAIVDQPGHHIAWMPWRLRARGANGRRCLHDTDRRSHPK
jgi:ribosomal protein L34